MTNTNDNKMMDVAKEEFQKQVMIWAPEMLTYRDIFRTIGVTPEFDDDTWRRLLSILKAYRVLRGDITVEQAAEETK